MARFGTRPRLASMFQGAPTSTKTLGGESRLLQKKPAKTTTVSSTPPQVGHETPTSDKEYQEWLGNLRQNEPELYQIYQEKGGEALNAALDERAAKQDSILSKLGKYKEGDAYNIATALKDNAVTSDDLTFVGFTKADVNTAIETGETIARQETIVSKLDKYKGEGGYNLAQALGDNAVTATELKDVGFTDADVSQAEKYVEETPRRDSITSNLETYKSDEGYNIAKALTDEAVTSDDLIFLGFSDQDIKDTVRYNETAAKLTPYKSEQGYNIASALRDNALTADELKRMGFSEEDIVQTVEANKNYDAIQPYVKDDKVDIPKLARDMGGDKASSLLSVVGISMTTDEAKAYAQLSSQTWEAIEKGAGIDPKSMTANEYVALMRVSGFSGHEVIYGLQDWIGVPPAVTPYATYGESFDFHGWDPLNGRTPGYTIGSDMMPWFREQYDKAKTELDTARERVIAEGAAVYMRSYEYQVERYPAKKGGIEKLKDDIRQSGEWRNWSHLIETYFPTWSREQQVAVEWEKNNQAIREAAAERQGAWNVYGKSLEGYKNPTGGGYNIALALTDKAITPKELKSLGFSKTDITNAQNAVVLAPTMPTTGVAKAGLPLLDVETQIAMAEETGQMIGSGYDIEALKATGLVVPDKTSSIGVRSATVTQANKPGKSTWEKVITAIWPIQIVAAADSEPIVIHATDKELEEAKEKCASGMCITGKEIYTYQVSTRDGNRVYVEALNKDAAMQRARENGYNASSAVQVFDEAKFKPPTKVVNSYNATYDDGTQETMVPFVDPETKERLLIPEDTATQLKDTPAYKDAKGTREEKLGKAYHTAQEEYKIKKGEFDDWLKDLEQNSPKLYTIYKEEGTEGLTQYIEKQDAAVAKVKPFETKDGYNLYAARLAGVAPDELVLAGFNPKDIKNVEDAYQTSIKTNVALPSEEITWRDRRTNKTYTNAEYKKLVAAYEAKRDALVGAGKMYSNEWLEMGDHPSNSMALSNRSANRILIEGGSMFVFSPMRALLPEVKREDISKLEWAIGGAQLATLALPVVGGVAGMPAKAAAAGKAISGIVVKAAKVARVTEPVISGGAATIFGISTAKSWQGLSPAEKVLAVGGTVLVATPAISAIVSKLPKFTKVSTNFQEQSQILDRINRNSYGYFTDEMVKNPKVVSKAWNGMCLEFDKYSRTELALKNVRQGISEMGLVKSGDTIITDTAIGRRLSLKAYLAKNPRLAELYEDRGWGALETEIGKNRNLSISYKGDVGYLNQLKATEGKLATKLDNLKPELTKKAQRFSDTFLENAKGLEAAQIEEARDIPKRVAMDSDVLTTQLFGTRDAVAVAKDTRSLAKDISLIESETKKGVSPAQAKEYSKLIQTLTSQIDDLNQELRIRNLLGEEVIVKGKNLSLEVKSLQSRLTKAVEQMEGFKGTVQEYPIYRKGELATQAQVLKMERDTMEAIQKTTEAMWGRQSYTSVLEKLNSQLDDIISTMRKAGLKTDKATKASFDVYGAIKKQDPRALKAAVEKLRLEAGKIPDKQLQLKAVDQIKQIEGPTVDKFWKAWKKAMAKAPEEGPVYEHTLEEYAAKVRKQKAEDIVQRRFEELTRNQPDYIKRRGAEAMMEELRKDYKDWSWEDFKEGKFKDLDDYLNVDRIEHELIMGSEGEGVPIEKAWQEKLAKLRKELEDIETHQAERDLTEKLKDKATNPKWQEALDNHQKELEREIAQKRIALKEATKTEPIIEKVVTEAELEKMKVAKVGKEERALATSKETEWEKRARFTAEERSAKLIKAARKGAVKAPEKVSATPYKGGFPGIVPKTVEQKRPEKVPEEAFSAALADLTRTMTLNQALRVLTEQGATGTSLDSALRAGVVAATKATIKGATAPQVRYAIKVAVQQSLRPATKTMPQPKLQEATKVITDTVTRIVPIIPPETTWPWPPKEIIPPIRRTRLSPQSLTQPMHAGPALAVWKQGRVWVSIFPPFRTTGNKEDVVYSLTKPPWGSVIARGRHAPKKTLRSMGKVPELITVPMGFETAYIRNGRTLTFSRQNGGRKRGRVIT